MAGLLDASTRAHAIGTGVAPLVRYATSATAPRGIASTTTVEISFVPW